MKGLLWLASYPKSGNTWLRVFLANLRAGAGAPADINRLDTTQFAARELWDQAVGWETAELLPAEREALRLPIQEALAGRAGEPPIKTHEVFSDPRDGRPRFSRHATRCVLYVVRNPLDVAVSLSHYNRESLDAAIAFINDPVAALDCPPNAQQEHQLICDWSTHVRSWTEAPELPVCVLRYEDMLAAPEAAFGRAAQAAGWAADPARVAQAVARSRFEELQQQENEKGFVERMANRAFFRRGRSGDWRGQLTTRHVGQICERHGDVMRKFGYLDAQGVPSK
ncbi:MAG TPA: sulfotransferase domain-containing protein [Opitutaceae bacterium]|jgi:aryl sulfotransferase|nr:sulfotransferase domain-containing protein [Opitutaceae bacterium]